MSYRLIDSNDLAMKYPEVNNMPCIYADLPNGLDCAYYSVDRFAEPKRGMWIPCKKQMPKPNETVNWVRKYYLVQNVFGDMMVASYRAKGDKTWWEQMYKYEPTTDEIVAWMELPEEYKEGGEE